VQILGRDQQRALRLPLGRLIGYGLFAGLAAGGKRKGSKQGKQGLTQHLAISGKSWHQWHGRALKLGRS
jgi:hypothetical protein